MKLRYKLITVRKSDYHNFLINSYSNPNNIVAMYITVITSDWIRQQKLHNIIRSAAELGSLVLTPETNLDNKGIASNGR